MYYFLIVALQVFCIVHILRNRKEYGWIFLVIFLPVVGGLVYLFMEVYSKGGVQKMESEVTKMVNPSSTIKKLERERSFADTYQNRVNLADAYLQTGRVEEAVELYEMSKVGLYDDDYHLTTQLISAYFHLERFEEAVNLGDTLKDSSDFQKSSSYVKYALSLEKTGEKEKAIKTLEKTNRSFSYFEHRYWLGMLLLRNGDENGAVSLWREVMSDVSQMNRGERAFIKEWENETRMALQKMGA